MSSDNYCIHGYKCLPGDGPIDAEIMCIGEAPGKTEEYTGVVLSGPTGKEFNGLYLQLAGLSRDQVYATNTVKHCSTINRKPTDADIKRCTECKLRLELQEVEPSIVILMGATACSLVPDIDLEVEHGIPRTATIFDREYIVIPMWHPALGLHSTSAITDLMADWSKLKGFIEDGSWVWPVDDKVRDYQLVEYKDDIGSYMVECGSLFTEDAHNLIAIDTESHGVEDFSIQFSMKVGTARMILMRDRQLVDEFVGALNQLRHEVIIMHNAPADLPMIQGLGINIRPNQWRDTMQEAYQLCRYPQGLKALSYRLLGRKRQSWEETVGGASRDALGLWLAEAIVHAQDNWTVEEKRVSDKTGKKLKSKFVKSNEERVLSRIFTHLNSVTYNPWGKLADELPDIGDLFKPYPIKGIGNCELSAAINYGCSDADDTLAVAMEFDKVRAGLAEIDEYDVDRCVSDFL